MPILSLASSEGQVVETEDRARYGTKPRFPSTEHGYEGSQISFGEDGE
jgi:hypothetical protein